MIEAVREMGKGYGSVLIWVEILEIGFIWVWPNFGVWLTAHFRRGSVFHRMFVHLTTRAWAIISFVVIIPLALLVWAHWPEVPIDSRYPVTEVVILKAERELILYSGGRPLKVYKVALGKNPVGQKEMEGDEKTPEGEYVISGRNPKSSFHLSLRISYPKAEQVLVAKEKGMNPGGDIMIHGIKRGFGWLGKLHAYIDWTTGCVAVTNEEIEEIYRSVPDGTKVTIKAN